eukprot:g1657.t1
MSAEIKEGDRIEITFGRRQGVQGTVLEKSRKRKGRYRIQLDGNGLKIGPVLEYSATKFTVVHRRQSRAPSTYDGAVFSKSDFDLMADTPSPGPKLRYGRRAPGGFSEDNQFDTSSDEDHNQDDKDFELMEQVIVARDSKGSLGIDVDRNLKIRRLNTQNALNSGLKVGQIIRKAHGISVSSPKELVKVVSNSMSHVAVLLVTSIEEKKSPREPIREYVPSPPTLSQSISPKTPSISRDGMRKKKERKMSIRPRPPPRPPTRPSQRHSTPDILSESNRAVSTESFEPISNEPSAMMGGVSSEPSTPLPFTRDSKIALLEARAKDLKRKYKIAKKNYYDDKSSENHDKAVSAKTAMLEAQKCLQDAMEVIKNASEKKKKKREVSSPSSISSPIRVPERKDSRSNVKQNVREERKQSDVPLPSQKGEQKEKSSVRTIIKEGTLLKKTNKSLFRGWKEVRVKVDSEGITYERVQSGMFGSSGRIHRVPYSDIKVVGSPEGADRDPKLGKMIEIVFYNENKKPWIFQAATLDDAMTWSAKIYYARRQSKNRRATQAQSDVAKSLANTMAVYVNTYI